MRRSGIRVSVGLILLLLLAGCWDKDELTEFGFVQAVAIHHNNKGKAELTTLFYKPTGGSEQGPATQKKGSSPLVIRTEADTVFEAVRDIPVHLGRKAKWDHMRVIIMSEDSARKHNIGETLDYFSRDHEPRETIFMMIGKGDVGQYLEMKPFIENTIGQQIRKTAEAEANYSSKTMATTLLDVAMKMKSPTKVASLPYVYASARDPDSPAVSGLAIIQNGMMVDRISSTDVQYLIMLLDRYHGGIIEFPCDPHAEEKAKESLEVITLKSNMTTQVSNGAVQAHVQIKLVGDAGELSCSQLITDHDFKEFQSRIKETMLVQLKIMTARLQSKKLDAIGIGNQIHRRYPKLWEQWKGDWGDHFANATIDFDLDVNVRDSGTTVGKPFSDNKK